VVYLRAIATELEQRRADIAQLESLDNGKALKEADLDVGDVVNIFRYYADQILELERNQNKPIDVGDPSFQAYIRYEPMGVAGLIIPWNYPLAMAAWKVAPCLAAGCTCVLKPSELTPLTALELAGIAKKVGLPAGVFNVVTGTGPDAGAPLSQHPGVEKVAFTGSVATGSKIAQASGKDIKKVSLEFGGKSPLIICSDADIDQAIDWITVGIFFNSGQVCSATSRVLVHRSIENALLTKLRKVSESIRVGPGLDPKTQMGPIVSESQYKKVLDYVRSGVDQGATLFSGGSKPDYLKDSHGFFLSPTIFTNTAKNMKIWNEEIFGPVLCIMPFDTEEEAIAIANETDFGLAGGVLSSDSKKSAEIAEKLRAGIVWINCSQPTFIQLPWGGVKKSGTGRELGPWGLYNFLEIKQVSKWVGNESKGWGWFTSSL